MRLFWITTLILCSSIIVSASNKDELEKMILENYNKREEVERRSFEGIQ
jgi:hypothetical protein